MRRKFLVALVSVVIVGAAVVQAWTFAEGHNSVCRGVNTLNTTIQSIIIQSRNATIQLKADYLKLPDGLHYYNIALALSAEELHQLRAVRC